MDSSKCENTRGGFCTSRLVVLRHGVTQVVDCGVSDLYAQRNRRRGLVDDCVLTRAVPVSHVDKAFSAALGLFCQLDAAFQ